jgi:hypothetical protein
MRGIDQVGTDQRRPPGIGTPVGLAAAVARKGNGDAVMPPTMTTTGAVPSSGP